MPSDTVVPLCTASQFTAGGYADLASAYTGELDELMAEATRGCEGIAKRKLAWFTGLTETTRASGIDPDEFAASMDMPMSLRSTLGLDYATALGGAGNMVRHCWLRETAPIHQELWAYESFQVKIVRSYGGEETLTQACILDGPDPDTGHVWFQLGEFIPVGSRIKVTYSGGYQTAPGDLTRACKYLAASMIVHELDPDSTGHNPDQLENLARKWLAPYCRDGAR